MRNSPLGGTSENVVPRPKTISTRLGELSLSHRRPRPMPMICQIWAQEMQIASLLFASGAAIAEHVPIVYALPIEFRLNDLASHALRVGSNDLPPNLEPNGAAQQAAYLNTSERRFACLRVR